MLHAGRERGGHQDDGLLRLNSVQERARTVCALVAAQTLAWASSYYLPAMLAAPMAGDLCLRCSLHSPPP